jgi:hypothetical protein
MDGAPREEETSDIPELLDAAGNTLMRKNEQHEKIYQSRKLTKVT